MELTSAESWWLSGAGGCTVVSMCSALRRGGMSWSSELWLAVSEMGKRSSTVERFQVPASGLDLNCYLLPALRSGAKHTTGNS